MNSKSEEDAFLISILSELKGYADHNRDELDYILQVVKTRRDELEQSAISKYDSNN